MTDLKTIDVTTTNSEFRELALDEIDNVSGAGIVESVHRTMAALRTLWMDGVIRGAEARGEGEAALAGRG